MLTFVAGAIAGLVTLFDLDRSFYSPTKKSELAKLYAWGASFILANSVAAAVVYQEIRDWETFIDMSDLIVAVIAGIAYLGIARAKIGTISVNDKDVPLGPEVIYQNARDFVFRHMKRISEQSLYDDSRSDTQQLQTLAQRVHLAIEGEQDAEVKRAQKEWLLALMKWGGPEDTKRLFLACFLKSGKRLELAPFLVDP